MQVHFRFSFINCWSLESRSSISDNSKERSPWLPTTSGRPALSKAPWYHAKTALKLSHFIQNKSSNLVQQKCILSIKMISHYFTCPHSSSHRPLQQHFSSGDLKRWPMILTLELDQIASKWTSMLYLDQTSCSTKLIIQTHIQPNDYMIR